MKQQTDLTKKDLSALAKRAFENAVGRYGKDNVVGGEWYVRMNRANQLLLIIPIEIRINEAETWSREEYTTVIA